MKCSEIRSVTATSNGRHPKKRLNDTLMSGHAAISHLIIQVTRYMYSRLPSRYIKVSSAKGSNHADGSHFKLR